VGHHGYFHDKIDDKRENCFHKECDNLECCKCCKCPPGPQGPQGTQGPQGLVTSVIYLASDVSIGNADFFGLGVSNPASTARNSVVVPLTSSIGGLVFSTRDNGLATGATASAQVFKSTDCGANFTGTGIIAIVTGPSCCGVSTNTATADQCDLLTVQVTTPSGVLSRGAAATIILNTP